MAFEGLSDKLNAVFKRLKARGKLKESDIKEVMREVRLALLEADVNYKVTKDFVAAVSERAVGSEVLESLTPAQQVIKIVKDEMTALMGSENVRVRFSNRLPTILDDVRAAGLRQNHPLQQNWPNTSNRGKTAAAGRLRRLPSRRHQAASGGRGTGRSPGL